MFSYRHAFHAGNHADVLKHATLIAILNHMLEKEAALTVIDTHAGAGLYRLDGDYAQTSGESVDGIKKLSEGKKSLISGVKSTSSAIKSVAKSTASASTSKTTAAPVELAPMLQNYLDVVAEFNKGGSSRVYPGSPFMIQQLLRDHDKLKLFELHPTDAKTLAANIAQLNAGRKIAVLEQDGFEGVKKFLPPPARRALVLCDPSYEMKDDYARVVAMVSDALVRFATGTYAVWYPIIPRPEAHDLPKKLKTLATRMGKSWLHATLTVKSSKLTTDAEGEVVRPGLPASGMFIINPPFTLKPALALALPQLVQLLGQDKNAAFGLESGG
ncbi:MAG: 23S rRNA (adenine(2030)-N(6))-methyltransferase RlmJ [Burkholderiaceae bacterium]|nr:23S rRNA (adenine(2030)-N(6))-methyltransferase RlmJ [Burkholderiaceae bacterium]